MLQFLLAVAPVATFFVAIGSLTTAFVSWKTYSTSEARLVRSASMSMLTSMVSDSEIRLMFQHLRVVRKHLSDRGAVFLAHKEFESFVFEANGRIVNAADVLKNAFNFYEMLAIGVRTNSLDEEIIRNWWRTTYVWHWIEFEPYIQAHRSKLGAPNLFSEYEKLVLRWATDDELAKLQQ